MKRRILLGGILGAGAAIAGMSLVDKLSEDPKPYKSNNEFLHGVRGGKYLLYLPGIVPGYEIEVEKEDGITIFNNAIHLKREKGYSGKSIDWVTAIFYEDDLSRITSSDGKNTVHFDRRKGKPVWKGERDNICYRRISIGKIYTCNTQKAGYLPEAKYVNSLFTDSYNLVQQAYKAAQSILKN